MSAHPPLAQAPPPQLEHPELATRKPAPARNTQGARAASRAQIHNHRHREHAI